MGIVGSLTAAAAGILLLRGEEVGAGSRPGSRREGVGAHSETCKKHKIKSHCLK